MKIGMDLDEVIIDYMESFLRFYYDRTGRQHFKENISSYYDLWTHLESTREEVSELMLQFIEHHGDNMPLVQYTKESITELNNRHELVIITSRPLSLRDKTESYLAKHLNDIPLQLHFSSDFFKEQGMTKAEICNSLAIPLFLEDSGEYALNCARNGIRILLFDRPWNKEYKHQNMVRVGSWPEALREIENLENQNI